MMNARVRVSWKLVSRFHETTDMRKNALELNFLKDDHEWPLHKAGKVMLTFQ